MIIGKINANAIPFIAIAGKTTVANRKPNGISAPMMKIAADRKIVPESIVPTAQSAMDTGSFETAFLNRTAIAKKTNAVMNLSIIFGKNPPGKVENSPEITPVVIASKKTDFLSGNNKIPTNIIVSIKSGFIPPLMPGMIT